MWSIEKINNLALEEDLQRALQKFYTHLKTERQLSTNSIDSYFFDIKDLLQFLQENKGEVPNLTSLSSFDLHAARAWLAKKSQTTTHRSNARAMSAVKTMFRFFIESNLCQNSEIFTVKRPKLPQLLPKAITTDQVIEFISGVDLLRQKKWQNLRDKSIILLMFTAGLRISEVLSIIKKTFLQASDCFSVIGKGSKQRLTPLLPIAKQAINSYLQQCPHIINNDDPLFISNLGKKYHARIVQLMFERVRVAINFPDHITPHTMRHSCATALLQSNQENDSILKIQKLLGHESLSTTQIYTKVVPSAIINALEKINYWDDSENNAQ